MSHAILHVTEIHSVDEVLAYTHQDLVHKLTTQFAITLDEATDLFNETKKWLWLCAYELNEIKHSKKKQPVVHILFGSSVVIIDEVWHLFLQYTRDYQEFCQKYFGFFIHHDPATLSEVNEYISQHNDKPEELGQQYQQKLRDLMEYVYDHLGPETASKWFSDYADKYSIPQLKKLHIHLKE